MRDICPPVTLLQSMPETAIVSHFNQGLSYRIATFVCDSRASLTRRMNEFRWKSDVLENRTIYVWGAGIDPWCCLFEDHTCVAVAYYNMEVSRPIRVWLCGNDETFTPPDGTTTYVF